MICWLPGKVNRSVHPLMVVAPVLVMVMVALNPLPQSLSPYVTRQAEPVAVGVGVGVVPVVVTVTVAERADRFPAASRA